jgi:hypothetical protein
MNPQMPTARRDSRRGRHKSHITDRRWARRSVKWSDIMAESTGLIVLCGPMGRDFRIAMLLTVLLRVNLNWQPAIHQPFT